MILTLKLMSSSNNSKKMATKTMITVANNNSNSKAIKTNNSNNNRVAINSHKLRPKKVSLKRKLKAKKKAWFLRVLKLVCLLL